MSEGRPDRGALHLRPLSPTDETQARQAHAELAAEGFEFLLGDWQGQPWLDYLKSLENQRRGVEIAEGRVPATFLVGDVNGLLVGRVSIRHQLNAELAKIGGHVGYSVRPEFRRRGYATEMLRQGLMVARDVGVERALVTCDDDNVGSATTIERCGGRLEGVVPGRDGSPAKRRYWIETA